MATTTPMAALPARLGDPPRTLVVDEAQRRSSRSSGLNPGLKTPDTEHRPPERDRPSESGHEKALEDLLPPLFEINLAPINGANVPTTTKEKNAKPKERQFFRDFSRPLWPAGLGFLSPLGAQEKTAGEPPKATLPQRLLGKTGISLPTVSMGVMNSDNPNLVAAALDAGITFLDTAHVYQRGRNEEMLGEVLKDRKRGSFFLATKVPGGPMDRQTGRFLPEASPDEFLVLI